MKKTVDIMDYCNKLFAADLFAGVVLEEDFDTGCNYTWSAAGDDWADKFRAELNGYIDKYRSSFSHLPFLAHIVRVCKISPVLRQTVITDPRESVVPFTV